MVARREVSPRELVDVYLERIERLNPLLGAFVTVAGERARAEARSAEARAGRDDAPPFLGVPISIKDLHATEGVATSMGLAALRNHVPAEDEVSVRRLRDAGFIILGKTTAPALGQGCVTEPAGFPPARNPFDRERSPGGSSGGAGAAAAARLCAVSHGSDGGGSIRIPSAWCGLVGVKPSRGRVSLQPRLSSLQNVIGPMAHTVADAAAVLDVLQGPELGDQYWAPPPPRPFLDEVGVDPGRLRVAVSLGGSEIAPAYRAALDRTVDLLAELGHDVFERDPDPTWSCLFEEMIDSIMGAGLRRGVEDLGIPLEGIDPIIAGQLELGAHVSADDYLTTTNRLLERARLITRFFSDVDVLLSPTAAKSPPRIGEHRELSVRDLFVIWERYVPFTTMWNNTGQPAITIPAGFDENGIPIGMQLVGRPADEATLFRLAGQLEQAQPWSHLRPQLP